MGRRRTAWADVAQRGRSQPGVWFLHPTLVTANEALLRHARRRVPPLRPTDSGRFEFTRTNHGQDRLGRPVFDLYIRYVPTRNEEP